MDNVLGRVRLAGLRIADPQGSKRNSLAALGLIVAAIALLILLARVFVLVPDNSSKVSALLACMQNVSDNLIATCIVVSIGCFSLSVLADPDMGLEDITPLPAHQIHSSLLEPLPTTENYWFRGRSGRFFRESVLPALVNAGARNASRRHISLLLPDPNSQSMLERYANYRNSLHFEQQGQWTARRVQAEVLATILAVAEQVSRSQFLEAAIAVGQDFALFRIDMSDSRMVMTREDPTWPAILCTRQSKFYSSFQEEIRQGMAMGRTLDLSKFPQNATVTETNFASLMAVFDFSTPINGDFAKEVIQAIRRPHSPYA